MLTLHGTSDNLFDSYLQFLLARIHVEETTQRQHFWKYSLLDIILLQHVKLVQPYLAWMYARKLLKSAVTQNL